MSYRLLRLPSVLLALLAAAPAYAEATGKTVALPEPSTMTLMALASAGVMIGRRMSRKKPPVD